MPVDGAANVKKGSGKMKKIVHSKKLCTFAFAYDEKCKPKEKHCNMVL